MNVSGERILIFGDSLSHHGSDDAVEIWDVNQGSGRSASAPGDLLASLLMEQGAAAVRIDANVGRSAINFWGSHAHWQRTDPQTLIANDQQFNPTKVIVFLGTNDLGSDPDLDAQGFQAIKDSFPSADFLAIGPPIFADDNLNTQANTVYDTLNSVFGSGNVIDARPLSSTDGRAADGIHFGADAAAVFAANLADAVSSAGGFSLWKALAIGAGALVGLVALGVWWDRRETRALSGPADQDDEAFRRARAEHTRAYHKEVMADPEMWDALEPIGVQHDVDDDGTPIMLDIRNCTCGSTLSKEHRGKLSRSSKRLSGPVDDIDHREPERESLGAGGDPSEGFDKVMKKWKRGISSYRKAINELSEGSDDWLKVSKAGQRLDKILNEAAAYLPGNYQHEIFKQMDIEKAELAHTVGAAEERGREVRHQQYQAEVKRLREEERDVQRKHDWMRR